MKQAKKVFLDTLKRERGAILTLIGSALCCGTVFDLYRLPLAPFGYAFLLLLFFGLIGFAAAFWRDLRREEQRQRFRSSPLLSDAALPPADSLAEAEYLAMLASLRSEIRRLQTEFEEKRAEDTDYYTAWVHQIKTPIAVLRMELDGDAAAQAELLQTEQYVDMVLRYLRLGSGSNDLVIREYPLDALIREAVRKFAPLFVAKRLGLRYEGTDVTVITDKKWMTCILEQLLSNAIKYTPSGCVTVSVEEDVLSVADTGIGIAPEDVPRIFEKGFTGENGRIDRRASGLGLYLCKKAADLLHLPLSVRSSVGAGSVFSLDLTGKTAAASGRIQE